MAFYFDSVFLEIVIAVLVSCVTVYCYFIYSFKYWQLKGIPTLPASFPFGNIGNILSGKQSVGYFLQEVYNSVGKTHKFAGYYSFSTPNLIVIDPEHIKNIFVRDFNYFYERGVYYNEKDDPISAHIFAVGGEKWKTLRTKLSPAFTSGKLKNMLSTILDRADQLSLYLKDAVDNDATIEMKDVFARYTTDVIGTCAFGIECNSLKDPDAEFRKYGQQIFKRNFFDMLQIQFTRSFKSTSLMLGLKADKPEVSNFFMKVVKDTIKQREEHNIRRNDFMDLLIQLKNKGQLEGDDSEVKVTKNQTITVDEAVAQTYLFFIAGFETSSSVLSFCLYELALNQDIQDRVRKEIKDVLEKHNGKMTYEALTELPYLDKVLEETMRKYPTLPQITRCCAKDYKIPGTETIIKKGTMVFIPVRALHHDPDIYPDPEKFDPDRFTEENKAKRHPFTFLPFGEGPRICIGVRFGMMQTRLGIMTVMMNYKVQPSKKSSIPLQVDPRNLLTIPLGGVWLKMTPLG